MNKETLRMQMLAGIITESEYKQKLKEAKQIGDIYHFTNLDTLTQLHTANRIELDIEYSSDSTNEYYSFTRDPNLSTLGEDKHQVRIKLNGDKMSNKYKFEPYVDINIEFPELSYSKNTPNFEAEERISSKYGKIDLTPYIEEIAIIDEENFLDYLEQNWKDDEYYDDIKQDYYDNISWIKSLNIPLKFISSNKTSQPRILNRNKPE